MHYRNAHNNERWPSSCELYEYPPHSRETIKLGQWCGTMRRNKRGRGNEQGRRSYSNPNSASEVAKLDKLGFPWAFPGTTKKRSFGSS